MTTLDYAYSLSSFKLTAGNCRFKQGAAPFADSFSDYDAMGIVTARNGEVIEDASQDYLKLCASGQTPVPLAIDLMDHPAQLGLSHWRTVLTLPERGGGIIGGVPKHCTLTEDWPPAARMISTSSIRRRLPTPSARFRESSPCGWEPLPESLSWSGASAS
jgi:hypothetical protein